MGRERTPKSAVPETSGRAVETPLRAATAKMRTEERMIAVFEKSVLGVEELNVGVLCMDFVE